LVLQRHSDIILRNYSCITVAARRWSQVATGSAKARVPSQETPLMPLRKGGYQGHKWNSNACQEAAAKCPPPPCHDCLQRPVCYCCLWPRDAVHLQQCPVPAPWIHCKRASSQANLVPKPSRVLRIDGAWTLQQHRAWTSRLHGCSALVLVVSAVRSVFALPAVLPSCLRSLSRHGTLSVAAAVAVAQRCQQREPSTTDAAYVAPCYLSELLRRR